jgi:hypothetical protein
VASSRARLHYGNEGGWCDRNRTRLPVPPSWPVLNPIIASEPIGVDFLSQNPWLRSSPCPSYRGAALRRLQRGTDMGGSHSARRIYVNWVLERAPGVGDFESVVDGGGLA